MTALSEELRRVILGRVQKAQPREIMGLVASLCGDPAPVVFDAAPDSTSKEAPRYSIGESIVTDNRTGLIWTRYDISTKRLSWADAKKAAAECQVDDHDDWRLPTIQELLTLVDYSRSEPAIDPAFGCQSSWYWTSTPYASSPSDCAWLVGFSYGSSDWSNQHDEGFVRAVRPGQSSRQFGIF